MAHTTLDFTSPNLLFKGEFRVFFLNQATIMPITYLAENLLSVPTSIGKFEIFSP